MKLRFSAVVQILTTFCLAVLTQGHAITHHDRAQDQPAGKNLVVPKGTNVVLTLVGDLRKGQTPLIVVVKTWLLRRRRDTPAQLVIARKPPGVFNMPGSVEFEVTGVVSVAYDLVPVSAAQTAKVNRSAWPRIVCLCRCSSGCMAILARSKPVCCSTHK